MAGKHTMRRSMCASYCIPMDLEISDVVRYHHTHEDGSKEIAVSSADLLLDDVESFILFEFHRSRYAYRGLYRCGNLNKNKMWETFIDELENTCISKSERIHKHHEKNETVYTVPVIGHQLFLPPVIREDFELGSYHELRRSGEYEVGVAERESKAHMKKIKMNPNKFMLWEGKYYDAGLVYIFKPELSNYLKPLGSIEAPHATILSPVNTLNGIIEFTKNITYHNSQHRREHQYCRLLHQGQGKPHQYSYGGGLGYSGGWEQKGAGDYLEINLGYPRSVTHIGTAGEFPRTQIFPTRRIVGRKRMKRFRIEGEDGLVEEHILSAQGNGVKMSKFAPHVPILSEDEYSLCWVTSYEVHYRNTVTNKWTLLTVTSANTDAFSEHLLDLSPHFNAKDGLFTQYLRIRPVECHHKPVMRLSVYGVDPTLCTKLADLRTGVDEDSLVSPTITYAIIQSSSTSGPYYVRDSLRGLYASYDKYRYNKDDPHWRSTRRKDFQGLMVDFHKTGGVSVLKTDYMHGIDYKNS